MNTVMRVETCCYCGEIVEAIDSVPAIADASAWGTIQADHAKNCEWAQSRALRTQEEYTHEQA